MVSPQAYKRRARYKRAGDRGRQGMKGERERARERERERESNSKLDPCGMHLGIDPFEEQNSNSLRNRTVTVGRTE